MLSNLVSLLTKSLSSTNQIIPSRRITQKTNNPFSESEKNNPFLSAAFDSNTNYGKNRPIAGGYFAGYYNGKPNIVGRKLFIEV